MCIGECIIVSLVPPRGMRFCCFGGIFSFGDLELPEIWGMAGESAALLIDMGVIAREFSGMRYGPIGSRYRHRQDSLFEVCNNMSL